jgi:hypothetical protein
MFKEMSLLQFSRKWHVLTGKVILNLVLEVRGNEVVYNVNLWPEDGQARPKHVVAIAAINAIPRQLCFWGILLPTFDIPKHKGDDEPEDCRIVQGYS